MPSTTTGVLWIHSAPLALQPHLNWAVARLRDPESGKPIRVSWRAHNQQIANNQSATRTTICAEIQFCATADEALTVADHLSGWPHLYFEMGLDAFESTCGKRICHTPELGTFRADTDAVGNVILNENVVRAIVARTAAETSEKVQLRQADNNLRDALDSALGGPWDRALEPMRLATAGYEVTDVEHNEFEVDDNQQQAPSDGHDCRAQLDEDVVIRLYPRRAVM